jgi:hypothetical protein
MSCHCVDNGIITCTDLDGPNDWVMDASVLLPASTHRVTATKTVLNLAPIGLKAFKHPFYSFDEASFIAGTQLQVHVLDTSDSKHIANWAKVLARDSTSDSEIEVGLGESIHRDSWICLRDSCKDPWVQSWYELAKSMIHLMIAAARSQLGIQVFFFGIEFWLKWAHLGDRAKEEFIKTYLGVSGAIDPADWGFREGHPLMVSYFTDLIYFSNI